MRIDKLNLDIKFNYPDPTSPANPITKCFILEDGKEIASAICVTHENDNFCKETGRRLALSRAIKGFTKEVRAAIWETYRSWGKQRW